MSKPTERPESAEAPPVGPLAGRLRRGAAMAAAGLVLVQGITFVQTLVLARLLTPEIVGVFAAATVLTTFLVVFTHGTLAQALIQRENEVDDAVTTVFWVTLATGSLMAVGVLTAAPMIGWLFHSDEVATVAAVMSGSVLLTAATSVPDAVMQRRFQFSRRVVVDPAVGLTYAVVSIACAAQGLGVWALAIGSYASLAVWIAASWSLSHCNPFRGHFSVRLWRELAVFSFPLLLDGMAARAQEAVELTIIGRGLDEAALGNYRYGRRIALIPSMAIVQVCSYVLFPAFSRIASDVERFRAAFLRSLRWIWRVTVPVAALTAALGESAVVLLLGEPWRGAGVALASMAGIGIGVAMTSVSAESLKGAGRSVRMNWMTGAGILSGIPLLLLLLPLGLSGVGLAVSGTAVVVGVTGLAVTRSVVGVTGRDMLRVMWSPVAASVPMFFAVMYFERSGGSPDELSLVAGIGRLVLEVLVFGLGYLLVTRLVAPADFAEIRAAGVPLIARLRGRTCTRA
ncbi:MULTISPECIES: oligosaccharide flippase family protein [Rhodococcus]|uniref:oligosaccharide flippase family protein n=1 Tax=Rhodococcus TaxID=1827 RepID=UPI00244CBAD8|nr:MULTISPECIES: oligosaccharide flippase family protein [Rhodococcus]WML64187.1 oligosaccharide flippase family protein [Rhodococcus sp. AH-ZY2]